MEARDDYILTSSDEAFALGEEGRQLALSLSAAAYEKTLKSILFALKEARDERSWNDYEQGSVRSFVSGLQGAATTMLRQACCADADDAFSMNIYRIGQAVSGVERLWSLTYFEQTQFDRATRDIIALFRETQSGELAEKLRAMYAATDPTIPREYANSLLPAEAA
jgi:hypothetical protein